MAAECDGVGMGVGGALVVEIEGEAEVEDAWVELDPEGEPPVVPAEALSVAFVAPLVVVIEGLSNVPLSVGSVVP